MNTEKINIPNSQNRTFIDQELNPNITIQERRGNILMKNQYHNPDLHIQLGNSFYGQPFQWRMPRFVKKAATATDSLDYDDLDDANKKNQKRTKIIKCTAYVTISFLSILAAYSFGFGHGAGKAMDTLYPRTDTQATRITPPNNTTKQIAEYYNKQNQAKKHY